jgi:hypothetical protein
MSKIVAFLKDRSGRKYKIEEVKQTVLLLDSNYWYNVLSENNVILYKNSNSKSAAIRYLEEQKGPCNSY